MSEADGCQAGNDAPICLPCVNLYLDNVAKNTSRNSQAERDLLSLSLIGI